MDINEVDSSTIVDEIEEIGRKQYVLLDRLQVRKYNILFRRLVLLVDELKARPGDRRRLLRAHYSHENLQVRLNAAVHTLAVAPEEARAQLKAISDLKRQPQALYAGMCLESLAEGRFTPA